MNLIDRQAIGDCLSRYCRGIDRLERDLVLSAYHPDAIDDHGEFRGNPVEFVALAFDHHRRHQLSHHHAIGNCTIELDGASAHVETCWQFFGHNRLAPDTLSFGRYLDHMEKRSGRWAIAARVCLIEAICDLTPTEIPSGHLAALQPHGAGSRDRSDLSYARPLRVERPTSALPGGLTPPGSAAGGRSLERQDG